MNNLKECLSIDQMGYLQKHGINIDCGSAIIYKISENPVYCGYSRNIVVVDSYINNYLDQYPSFTLQDILQLLPKQIVDTYNGYRLTIEFPYNEFWVGYTHYETREILKGCYGDSLIDAAYKMLCWCIENGYVKTKQRII